jgi:hypothetical protein
MLFSIFTILSLGLLPVYIFRSGGIQPVDICLVIVIIAALSIKKESKYDTSELISNAHYLVPYVIWATIVNIGYLMIDADYLFGYIFAIIFVIYNFIIFYSFIRIFAKLLDDKNFMIIYSGLLLSILLAFLVKGAYEEGSRNALSFNNPNQLGYFAIIIMSYAIILINIKSKMGVETTRYQMADIALILCANFFAVLSASRGAIAGIAILDVWLLFNLINVKNAKMLISTGMATLIAIAYILFINPTFVQEQLEARPGRSITDINPEIVAKDQVQRNLTQLESLFGGLQLFVGEGGSGRSVMPSQGTFFGHQRRGIEVHNTFGSVLKIYGIIGLILFLIWAVKIFNATFNLKAILFVWAALMGYNMTHNGIRFRALWILLSFLVVAAFYVRQDYNRSKGEVKILKDVDSFR